MELNFKFSVEEVNAILQALGARPYAEVQALISKIKDHGEAQIAAANPANVIDATPVSDPAPELPVITE
jgi:hypothetical protein